MAEEKVERNREVYEKWGFGMAPPKPVTQNDRLKAASYALKVLEGAAKPSTAPEQEKISTVKGLFSRVFKEDQWDWFTVKSQLGYPSPGISKLIADQLYDLRRAAVDGDAALYSEAESTLRRLPTRKCLSAFLGKAAIPNEYGAGWIYVLSTRELNDLLKVGMTTRSVEARVREINSATGVAIPYSVRACWRVTQPARAEKLVHQLLDGYRIRGDREFFRGDFRVVSRLVQHMLSEQGLEIRTLANLAALADAP